MPLQKIPKETIMAAIAKIGPSQPIDIRKELKEGDSFLIGAMLSELVADGKLIITKVRRGGSPFYYDPTVPESLDKASQWLNEKDRRTYALLKEQRVMREDAQEPLVRVGLQNMPDFSKRMEIDGVVYWRHYLTHEEEARKIAGGGSPSTDAPIERAANHAVHSSPPVHQSPPVHHASTPDVDVATQPEASLQETLAEPPAKTEKTAKKQRTARKKAVQETLSPASITDAAPKDLPKKKGRKKSEDPIMMPDGAVMISPQEWLAHDTLYARVEVFAQGMKVRDARVHKPHSELTCIMTIDTQFGPLDTFVHAFNRKFTPDDIKTTMPRARELGLPIIILSADAVPSKVSGVFKGMPNIIFRTFGK